MELDEIIQRSIVTQTLENESRQLKIKKLKDAVSALGFNVVQNVPYDGNCFFHAVGLLCGKDGHLFREETVCFIEQEVGTATGEYYSSDHWLFLCQKSPAWKSNPPIEKTYYNYQKKESNERHISTFNI